MKWAFVCALVCAGPAFAEGPKPFPDFKAKRVKPPKSGAGKRITIQIEPTVAAPAVAAAPAASEPTAPASPRREAAYAWYWQSVSPGTTGAGPARLEPALRALSSEAGSVVAPRLQRLQDMAVAQGREILRATVGTEVSPALVLAVIAVESSGKPKAESKAGAQGLMQLMPATAERFGVEDSFDPAQNIKGGVAYLNWLMGEFERDPILVLAGYNAGEGAVRKYAGVPPFAETRDYVPKVLAAFQVAQGLCLTPPQLISDGCVFAAMN